MNRKHWIGWVVCATVLASGCESAPTSSDTQAESPTFAREHVIPRFKEGVSAKRTSLLVSYRRNAPLDRLEQFMKMPGVAFGFDSPHRDHVGIDVADSEVEGVRRVLAALPWVRSVWVRPPSQDAPADGPMHSRAWRVSSSKPGIATSAGFTLARRFADILPWGVSYANGDLARSIFGNYGSGIKVGVLDTGIDCNNSDLSGVVVGGEDFAGDSYDYCDDPYRHGTAVAGIIAASGNGSGVIGMAPSVSLYSIRVVNASGATSANQEEAGIAWAIAHSMQVINISLANCGRPADNDDSLNAVINSAVANGIVVVAAAGNGIDSPKGCTSSDTVSTLVRPDSVIGVTAAGTDTLPKSGYQYGHRVFLAAPTDVKTDSIGSSALWTSFGGTSAATPHVTGAVALLLSAGVSPANVRSTLAYETQRKPGTSLLARNDTVGYGLVDAAAALSRTPQIASYTIGGAASCSGGTLHVGDSCTVTANLAWADPFGASFTWYDTVTAAGSISKSISGATFSFTANGTASYYINIYGYASDQVTARHSRIGQAGIITFVVCPGGEEFLRSGSSAGPPPVLRPSRPRPRGLPALRDGSGTDAVC